MAYPNYVDWGDCGNYRTGCTVSGTSETIPVINPNFKPDRTMETKLTKQIANKKTIWFCGCEMNISTVLSEDDWIKENWHNREWNRKKFRHEYICHKNKIVKIDQYEKFHLLK